MLLFKATTKLRGVEFPVKYVERGELLSLLYLSPLLIRGSQLLYRWDLLHGAARPTWLTTYLGPITTVHGGSGHLSSQVQDAGGIEAPSLASKTLPNTGTSTPTTVKDGNILFECTVCKRQVREISFTSSPCPMIQLFQDRVK